MGINVKTQILPKKEVDKTVEEKKFDVILYGYKANSAKDLVKLWKSGDTENLASITGFGSPTLNSLLMDLETSNRRNASLNNYPNPQMTIGKI